MLWCNLRLDRQYNALRCVCFIGCRTAPQLNSSYFSNNCRPRGTEKKHEGTAVLPYCAVLLGSLLWRVPYVEEDALAYTYKHGDGLRVAFKPTSCM